MMNDPDEAEEVLQLTFIKACEKIDSFEERSAMSTWLYRIATNEALMKMRRQKRTFVSLNDMADTIQPDDLPHNMQQWVELPTDTALNTELRDQLEAALRELPEGLRLVFVLRELQGMNTEETAQALELTTSTVKVRLHRARLRLRELLADYFTEEGDEQ
jgi:RNA polymerase sigma-70 factor (ECF subfamily)